MTDIGGPFYEDLPVGRRFTDVPAVTLTDGLASAHAAIVGGRFHLMRDRQLAQRVAGRAIVAPALAWDVVIGQSTVVTERGLANLFYRGLVFRRLPAVGDTLKTVTTIVGKRPASPKPDRPPRGLVTMRIAAVDQEGRAVLDFHRCALIPARGPLSEGAEGETEPTAARLPPEALAEAVTGWDLAAFRNAVTGPHFDAIRVGTSMEIAGGDVVSSAPELARLTLNLAAIHHDEAAAGGRRLVYGGHTIGLAAAQISRAFPGATAIVDWQSCDHTGPVHEGDTLHTTITVEDRAPLAEGGGLVHLRARVTATTAGDKRRNVLDWRLAVMFA